MVVDDTFGYFAAWIKLDGGFGWTNGYKLINGFVGVFAPQRLVALRYQSISVVLVILYYLHVRLGHDENQLVLWGKRKQVVQKQQRSRMLKLKTAMTPGIKLLFICQTKGVRPLL